MLLDEDEKKKREEEAKSIINSVNFKDTINSVNYANSNNFKIETKGDEEQSIINKINEANSIINSVNPRQNVEAPSINEEDRIKSQESTRKFINLMDGNIEENNDIKQKNIVDTSAKVLDNQQKEMYSTNNLANNQDLSDNIQQLKDASVPTANINNNTSSTSKNFTLAGQQETENSQKLTATGISAMQKADEKNKNINKGGLNKFNEFADTVLNNIYGGVKQTASGLVNVVTTIAGFGIKGLEGVSRIVGSDSTADNLNEVYNNIVDTGSDINETANYESTINSQVKDDVIRTAGNVTNVISNMVSSQLIGYATGISGTIIQGMSVGGNSAQEVLSKNKDNIAQASLTGIAKGYTSYLTEKMFDANILTKGMNKTSIEKGINKLISNKIQSEFGKEFANKTVGIIGENIEELVEDNAGYLIDKLINNEELPDFQQWWNNTTETAKITTLSTFIMGLIGLGGQSFKDIEKDMETQYWIEEASKIIENENLGIHFNSSEVKDLNTIQDYYITNFTSDGEISKVIPTKGITIENTNAVLNVTPVIVRDSNTDNYNVIDGNTGVMLDSTYYETRLEAEQSYNQKINRLSDLQIKDINKKVNEASYMITDRIMNMVNQAQTELQKDSNIEDNINTMSENFRNDLDIFKNGKYTQKDNINVLDSLPDYFYNLGYEIDKPLVLNMHKLSNIMKEPKGNYNGVNQHGITMDIIEKLPEAISNPLNVIKNPNFRNRFVIVTDLTDQYGDIILVPVEINNTAEVQGINKITSIYGKETYDLPAKDALKSYMEQNKDNIVYDIDNERSSSSNYRLQLPSKTRTTSNVNNSVTRNNHNVKLDTTINNMQYSKENILDNVKTSINQIQDKGKYNRQQTRNILDYVSNNIDNVYHQTTPSGTDFLYTKDSDGNITNSIELSKSRYTGFEIKEAINNIFRDADFVDNNTNASYNDFEVGEDNGRKQIEEQLVGRIYEGMDSSSRVYEETRTEKRGYTTKEYEQWEKSEDSRRGTRKVLENIHSSIYEEAHTEKRGYTTREYGQWEKSIKPIERNKLTTEHQKIIDKMQRQYNKDIVFFDGKNSLYSAGASIFDNNKLYIDTNQYNEFGNKIIYHEIMESNIFNNETENIEYIKPSIEKIINDSNFEQQKQEFWKNETDNIPSDYLIAKDILCDRFAELETNTKWDYKNVLSNETNMTVDYAIENFNNAVQTNQNQKSSTFYDSETNYAVSDIKNVTEAFNKQKEYTKKEMADIWNNEISENKYDVKYDSDGNIESYIAFEEDGKNLVVNQYDSNDNIVKSEMILDNKGKYTSEVITNAIEKVSSLYDENRPIKGQVDIEGNGVLNMKKNNTSYTGLSKLSFEEQVEKWKNGEIGKNTHLIVLKNTPQVYQDLGVKDLPITIIANKLERIYNKSGKQKGEYHGLGEKVKELPKAIENPLNIVLSTTQKDSLIIITDLADENDNIVTVSLKLNGKGQVEIDNISQNIESNVLTSAYGRKNYDRQKRAINGEYTGWMQQNQDNNRIIYDIDEDITKRPTKGQGLQLPNSDNRSNVNNSIPQKTKVVKSENTVINNNMQNTENNTSDEVRSMKKSNSSYSQKAIEKELHNRIQNAIVSKNSRKNTYLGDVSQKISNTVKRILGIDIAGRKHIISDNDIRHMIKQHGNIELEKSKGQIAITLKDIEKIPDIINNYDKITKGTDNRNHLDGKEFQTIRYIKQYSDNISYVVEVIADTGNNLTIKTMWKKPVRVTNNQKIPSSTSKTKSNLGISTLKQNPIGVNHDNTSTVPQNTSETKSNSGSNTNISQNTENVKNDEIRFAKRNAKETNKQEVKRNAERADSYIEQEIQKIEKTGKWDDSIPVTKLTDIRRTIENYLGLGVQKGHFRQQAYGIYKTNRDVLRTKELKDMDTILHETGHALDLGNRLNIDKENIANELFNAIDSLGGYEKESRQVRLDEGFAEVIREYSIIPEQAKIDYPQTVAVLEGIRKNDKSFDNFITKIQQQTYNYIHQKPRNRTLSNMSIGEQTDVNPVTKESIKQIAMILMYDKDYATKKTVNQFSKISGNEVKASENAYYLTRLSSGLGDKVVSMLSDGYIDKNGRQLFPGLNKIGKIFEQEQEMLKTPKKYRQKNIQERFNDLRVYLMSQRDLEYKAKNLITGLRTSDTQNNIEQFKNDTQIQEAAQLVYDALDGILQYAVDNHVIDKDTAKTLRESNAFYIPMQRVIDNNGNIVGRRGAVTDIIKKRTGSELDIKDVFENIISNATNIIQQVENNNVLKALYKQGEDSGLTGAIYDVIPAPMKKVSTETLATWENELKKQGIDTSKLNLEKTIDLFVPDNKVDSKRLVTNFINDNGQRVYLQFRDNVLFNSIMNLDTESNSKLLKLFNNLNMPLRYGATMANLGFALPNMISDTLQATIFSKAGFIPVIDNALGVIEILGATNEKARNFINKVAPSYAQKINYMYTLYNQSGATSGTRIAQERKSAQSLMKDIYGTKNSEILGIEDKYKPLKRVLDILTYIPELSEQSTRFRVFEKNYDYYKNKGSSEMDARISAALESRDATQDFSRMGTLSREINKLIPFSAARMGSAYTFAEKVKANPKQVATRIALLTAVAMAIKAMGYDDDEIEELNQRKKDDNFVLKVGDTVVTIKKPQGILRSMINFAEYIQDLFTGHIEDGKEGERLAEWMNNAIMDNMPADEVSGLVPNALAPLIENAVNKDFYYNTDIVKSYDEQNLPNSEQYYEYNSQLAILLGKIFNYSPAKIDNAISGYFGGLGTQVTGTIDFALGKMGISNQKPEMGAESNSIGKRFVVNVNSNSASLDEIYNRQTELTKKSNSEKGLTEEEDSELKKIKNATTNISKINKQIKEIKKDLTINGKQKAEQIKELQKQRTDLAREALGKENLYSESKEKNSSIQFYTTSNALKKNGYSLQMTSDMKKEYEKIAYEYYSKYEKQNMYSKEKLDKIKDKAKDYAKNQMFSKYKNKITKSK